MAGELIFPIMKRGSQERWREDHCTGVRGVRTGHIIGYLKRPCVERKVKGLGSFFFHQD